MGLKVLHCRLLPFARPAGMASIDLAGAGQKIHMERPDRAAAICSLYMVIG